MATVTESTPKQWMTTEELLALPDDGVDRWLIDGELRENGMTTRGFPHAAVEAMLSGIFLRWLQNQPKPRGRVLSGEARVRLRQDPDVTVGIDVVLTRPQQTIGQIGRSTFLEGPPLVAVEILSPSDEHQDVAEKISSYLGAGVALVWVVDPYFQTVTVHRPGSAPVMFNVEQELSAEPVLPGFRVPVLELFAE